MLDSWVRFEQAAKESEQAELTKAVIDKVLANLKDQATQKELLTSAVAEIERELSSSICLGCFCLTPRSSRTRQGQGHLSVVRPIHIHT